MPGTLTPSLMANLMPIISKWMARQRWYAGKGRIPALTHIGALWLEDPTGESGIHVHLLQDRSGETPTTYQVPLTCRADPLAGCDDALVATAELDEHGTRYFYDAPHDPAFSAALLALMLDERTAEFRPGMGEAGKDGRAKEGRGKGPRAERHQGDVAHGSRLTTGHLGDLGDLGELSAARVLRGEQSNTSIILDLVDDHGDPSKPLICKLFRVLQHGENPDVVVQSTLSAAGSDRVPSSVGYVHAQWPDPSITDGVAGGHAHGHLAFVQEFLPGVEDAWRVALGAVASGTDFSLQALSLGRATAQVHATLAQTMGTREATQDDVLALARSMRTRHATAVSEVPALAEYDELILASIKAASSASWPALQRIHGDYHLGQVLEAPGRGWVLVDFEGEPLRPLAERNQPELILRDVAGMLRSFDYAAGSWEKEHPGRSAASWASQARKAFLEGYTIVAGRDPREDSALLNALELDKALYEVVYEARNRPTWLSIPTNAIARLSAGPRSDLQS
jgi:maltokinase